MPFGIVMVVPPEEPDPVPVAVELWALLAQVEPAVVLLALETALLETAFEPELVPLPWVLEPLFPLEVAVGVTGDDVVLIVAACEVVDDPQVTGLLGELRLPPEFAIEKYATPSPMTITIARTMTMTSPTPAASPRLLAINIPTS